jgi:hypothetical protein
LSIDKAIVMSLTLRTALGYTEAVIEEDGSLKHFYHIADLLRNELQAKFARKEDEFDAIYWPFLLGAYQLTLHYSIYNGISVFPTKTQNARKRENRAVVELASVLQGKRLTPPSPKGELWNNR